MPGTSLSTLFMLTCLILTTTLWGNTAIIHILQWEIWGTETLKNSASYSQLVAKFEIQTQTEKLQKAYS